MRSRFQASLRDADAVGAPIRGLKATATVMRSLRDPPGQSKVVGNAQGQSRRCWTGDDAPRQPRRDGRVAPEKRRLWPVALHTLRDIRRHAWDRHDSVIRRRDSAWCAASLLPLSLRRTAAASRTHGQI